MSWWTNPTTFSTEAATFNAQMKILGDSQLPKPVRQYLRAVEHRDADDSAELRTRPNSDRPENYGITRPMRDAF